MNTLQLSDLYDGDKRTLNPHVTVGATLYTIPHPLRNTQYADGVIPCTHARKHHEWEYCKFDIRDQT